MSNSLFRSCTLLLETKNFKNNFIYSLLKKKKKVDAFKKKGFQFLIFLLLSANSSNITINVSLLEDFLSHTLSASKLPILEYNYDTD